MSREIDYGNLMHQAMRGLIRNVLDDIAANGLPGAHHFFITFDTGHPEAELADWLSDRYPEEMTVVIQHWFDNLNVGDDGFAITLNFGDNPEPLYIPYDAIRTFVDPSVEFGLRFENSVDEDEDIISTSSLHLAQDPSDDEEIQVEEIKNTPPKDAEPEETQKKDAQIVSLDSFRK